MVRGARARAGRSRSTRASAAAASTQRTTLVSAPTSAERGVPDSNHFEALPAEVPAPLLAWLQGAAKGRETRPLSRA
jgi:hypothetical protein